MSIKRKTKYEMEIELLMLKKRYGRVSYSLPVRPFVWASGRSGPPGVGLLQANADGGSRSCSRGLSPPPPRCATASKQSGPKRSAWPSSRTRWKPSATAVRRPRGVGRERHSRPLTCARPSHASAARPARLVQTVWVRCLTGSRRLRRSQPTPRPSVSRSVVSRPKTPICFLSGTPPPPPRHVPTSEWAAS